MRLLNKVAIITGAGSGFGRASAYLFAKEGARVVVADVSDVSGEETAAAIGKNGGQAFFVHTDVARASDMEHLVRAAMGRFGKIDVLFNNAGVGHKAVEVENLDESVWDHVYAVNVRGIFLGVKYVVPEMKKAGGGVIINTGSVTGHRPPKNVSAYASSKGAVITLTKALAIELAPFNIRVNTINPTIADTPLLRGIFGGGREKEMAALMPLGRLTKPEDVACAAVYLASDEASMLTGSSINPDGGRAL